MDAKGRESEPVCIDDEIPFDIPDGWEWARLENLCSFGQCVNIKLADVEIGTWTLELEDIEKDSGRIRQKKRMAKGAKGSTKHLFSTGMVLYSKLRPYLNKVVIADESGVCSSEILPLDFGEFNTQFAQIFLMSPRFLQFAKEHSYGVKMPRLGTNDGKAVFVPIPPLAEQRRIAERVSELMLLIEEYGRLEDEREALDAALPERLRKSVLQMAVEGKLVAQDPADEPANVLLERIRAERTQLIREKKIKPPKGGESVIYLGSDGRRYEKRVDAKGRETEPVCIDDEIPFEIPESWEWARLTIFFTKMGSGSTPAGGRKVYKNEGPMLIRSQNVHNDGLRLNDVAHFERSLFERRSTHVAPNDILLNITGASIGRCAIVSSHIDDADVNQHVLIMRPICPEANAFIHKAILSELVQSQIMGSQVGATKEGLSAAKAGFLLIPIPPLAEQHRIVECLDSILANIN